MKNAVTISNEISKFVYELLKEYGICQRCRANFSERKRVLCEECLKYWRIRSK